MGLLKIKAVNLIVIVTEVNSDIIVTIYSTDNASYKNIYLWINSIMNLN